MTGYGHSTEELARAYAGLYRGAESTRWGWTPRGADAFLSLADLLVWAFAAGQFIAHL